MSAKAAECSNIYTSSADIEPLLLSVVCTVVAAPRPVSCGPA